MLYKSLTFQSLTDYQKRITALDAPAGTPGLTNGGRVTVAENRLTTIDNRSLVMNLYPVLQSSNEFQGVGTWLTSYYQGYTRYKNNSTVTQEACGVMPVQFPHGMTLKTMTVWAINFANLAGFFLKVYPMYSYGIGSSHSYSVTEPAGATWICGSNGGLTSNHTITFPSGGYVIDNNFYTYWIVFHARLVAAGSTNNGYFDVTRIIFTLQ